MVDDGSVVGMRGVWVAELDPKALVVQSLGRQGLAARTGGPIRDFNPGERLRQPVIAWTGEELADQGRDGAAIRQQNLIAAGHGPAHGLIGADVKAADERVVEVSD